MSRVLHEIELGVSVTQANNDTPGFQLITNTTVPGGDASVQDAAPLGSLYFRSGTSEIYKKIASANATSDWEQISTANLSQLSFRSELVRSLTNDTLSAGNVDPTTFSDNESGTDHTAYAVGEYVIGDADGTPALFEVTAISAPNITLAAAGDPLADNDSFIVREYYPDSPAAQEGSAHVMYNGSTMIKLGDVNWDFATGINLSSTYVAANGNISTSDTVESAIEKLDGNQQDIQAASGLSQGATDYGSFTGDILSDTQNSKQLFQQIEDFLSKFSEKTVSGITGSTLVDSVAVDDTRAVKWLVTAYEEASPSNVKSMEVYAVHDGTAAADATSVDDTVYAKLRLGSNFNLNISVDISGAGAAQVMRILASSSTAGVTVCVRRLEVACS